MCEESRCAAFHVKCKLLNVHYPFAFQCITKCCRFKASPPPPPAVRVPPSSSYQTRYHGWILWPAGPIYGPAQRKWTHSSLRHLIMPLCDWWCLRWMLSVHRCCPAPALMFFHPALSNKQHKSHVEDPSHGRPVNDRKRKFVDAELALDTEGNADTRAHRCDAVLFQSASSRWLFAFCFSELFQDLSQLQEIWIAEGQSRPSVKTN